MKLTKREPAGTPAGRKLSPRPVRRPAAPTSGTPLASGRATARIVLLWTLILILLGWTWIAWPRLTLPLSSVASMVDTLDTDVVYDGGVGLTEEQKDDIRGAIGTRPITMVFLPDDDDAPDESDVCQGVSSRLPEVQLVIVRGPGGSYGCTGDKVPVKPDNGGDMRGLPYELRINYALDFVADPVAKAQGVALVHDSMVRSDRLAQDERSFRTPWTQVLFTLLIVVGVLAAVLLILNGLRWLALYFRAKRNREAEQEQLRDDLDDALAELALVVVDQTPEDPRAPRGSAPRSSTGLGSTGRDSAAAGYVDLLGRARTAGGGWAGLLREARALLGDSDRDAVRRADRTVRS